MTTETLSESLLRTDHDNCFVCGKNNACSLGIVFLAHETGVCATFQLKYEHQGYNGILHGGIISTLLDEAMTQCLFCKGVKALTGDLHVRFLHPVPYDAPLELRAGIVSERRSLYYLKAELLHDNQVMAWAEGKFMNRSIDPLPNSINAYLKDYD